MMHIRALFVTLASLLVTVCPATLFAADPARQNICLNGDLWQIITGDKLPADPPQAGGDWKPARVPGCFRERLGCEFIDGVPDPHLMGSAGAYLANLPWHRNEAWYRLEFFVPAEWRDRGKIALAFDGVDYRCKVVVNGKMLGSHEGAHAGFEIGCGDALRFGEMNTLDVWVQGIRPFLFYGDRESHFAGIWGNVFLRSYPAISIEYVKIMPSVRKKALGVWITVRNSTTQPQRASLAGAVLEGTQQALSLPPDDLDIAPGKTETMGVILPWKDAKLWGFAPYGEPVLYTLQATLKRDAAAKEVIDTTFSRFGFRELWAEGNQFYFNGKPFFLKGDLISVQGLWADNREAITQYLQAERGANINFIRLHYDGFSPAIRDWLDVADELGMLIEPEQHLNRGPQQGSGAVETEAAAKERIDVLTREWENFAPEQGNHPSVAVVSIDNEAVSQSGWGQPPAPGKPHPVWATLNDIQSAVHAIRPDWLVEAQGDVWLGVAFAEGYFKPLQVFDVHPYGVPLAPAMTDLCKQFKCPADVPIHVGEIYGGLREPFNWWTRPAEMLRKPQAIWFDEDRCGAYYAQSILGVKSAGAAGASLCSGTNMYFGFGKDRDDVRFGPWSKEYAGIDEDFSNIKESGERGQLVNVPAIQIPYPSLAGRGMKVRWIVPTNPNDYGGQFNWFDPTRPAWTTDCIYDHVKQAFNDVDGQDTGPLAEHRAPEVVVVAAVDGKPLAGIYVRLRAMDGQPVEEQMVMTDSAGTAWFVLAQAGQYQFDAIGGPNLRPLQARTIHVDAPKLQAGGGYSHIQFEPIGDAEALAKQLRATLEKPTPVITLAKAEHVNNRAADDEQFERDFRQGIATLFCHHADFEGDDYCCPLPGWVNSCSVDPMNFMGADAWSVPATEAKGVGRLSFDMAPDKIKRAKALKVLIDADDTGAVFLRLRGPRWEDVIWDSEKEGGSVFAGTGARVHKEVVVPLEKYPAARVLEVRRQSGAVKIYQVRVVVQGEAEGKK